MIRSLCVFCGSRLGTKPAYQQAARELGERLGQKGIRLIYGGGHVGLMGVTADACLKTSGEVIGVIPQGLVDAEAAHSGLTQLHITQTMHERKAMMADLAEAFVALPGGFGTLDELCEIITWAQLRLHSKPIYLMNTEGYFDSFLRFLEESRESGFISQACIQLFEVVNTPDELMAKLMS